MDFCFDLVIFRFQAHSFHFSLEIIQTKPIFDIRFVVSFSINPFRAFLLKGRIFPSSLREEKYSSLEVTFRELFQQETEENSKEEVQRGIYLRIKYRSQRKLSLGEKQRRNLSCRLGMKPSSLLLVYSVVSRAMNEGRRRNAFPTCKMHFAFVKWPPDIFSFLIFQNQIYF